MPPSPSPSHHDGPVDTPAPASQNTLQNTHQDNAQDNEQPKPSWITHSARLIIAALGASLAYYIYAEITGNPVWVVPGDSGFIRQLNTLLATQWGVVSLLDLYAGFAISMAIIIAVERKLWIGLAWAVPILFIGNVLTAIWFVLRFPDLVRRLVRD